MLFVASGYEAFMCLIVKMNIPRLLGSSDDKEKIGVARPEGPPLWGFCLFGPRDKN